MTTKENDVLVPEVCEKRNCFDPVTHRFYAHERADYYCRTHVMEMTSMTDLFIQRGLGNVDYVVDKLHTTRPCDRRGCEAGIKWRFIDEHHNLDLFCGEHLEQRLACCFKNSEEYYLALLDDDEIKYLLDLYNVHGDAVLNAY